MARVLTTPARLVDRLLRPGPDRWNALVWLLPVAVYLAVRHLSPSMQQLACAGVVALALIALVQRAPTAALLTVLVLAPLNIVVFSWLYRTGVPAPLVRQFGYWKELLVLGLAVAAVRHGLRHDHKLDTIDKVVIAYIVGTALYLLVPGLFLRSFPVGDFHERSIAWRNLALFPALFVAVRHGPFNDRTKRLASTAVMIGGACLAIGAAWEFIAADSWNRFAIGTLHLPQYQHDVLQTKVNSYNNILTYGDVGGRQIVRVGSILFDPLAAGFAMVLPFAVGIERIMRNRSSLLTQAITIGCGLGILFTQTRSAILAAAVVLLLALWVLPGRSSAARTRFGMAIAAALILVIPFMFATGVSDRVLGGDTTSTQGHAARTSEGLADVVQNPLGRGLGTAPDTALRFGGDNEIITENYYLQVADEVGVINGFLFVAIVLLVIRATRRSIRPDPDQPLPAAMWGALIALSTAAMLLHVWSRLETSLVMWGAAGVVLLYGEVHRVPPRRYAQPVRAPSRHG